ncbi:MAG TPA: cutinase family protein, partial [Candidatus Dormibacteraeota bacterium]
MRRRLLAAAGAAVAAVVAFGALFSYPGPGVASGGAPACAAVLVVGLRGNGDTPVGGHGMGDDSWAVASRLSGVAVYGFPYATGPWWRLGGHVRAAASALAAFLGDRARGCPDERLVLLGQSEGAAVVHLALPSVGAQLAAAVLLADPLRLAGGQMDDLGRPPGGLLAPVLLGPIGGLGQPREVVPGALA